MVPAGVPEPLAHRCTRKENHAGKQRMCTTTEKCLAILGFLHLFLPTVILKTSGHDDDNDGGKKAMIHTH